MILKTVKVMKHKGGLKYHHRPEERVAGKRKIIWILDWTLEKKSTVVENRWHPKNVWSVVESSAPIFVTGTSKPRQHKM